MDTSVIPPRQIGTCDARPQKSLGATEPGELSVELMVQFGKRGRSCVGQMGLELRPDLFFGIEFRGICGETVDVETVLMLAEVVPDKGTAMGRKTVPKQDHLSGNRPAHVAKKTDDFHTGDVLMMTMGQQSKPATTGRESKGRDRRGAIPPITMPEHGRLAHRRPCSTHRGDEQKTAFVQECQVRPQSVGFFLSEATSNVSIAQWPPRPVGSPFVPASGDSTASPRPTTARPPTEHIAPRNAPRSVCRSVATSRVRSDTRHVAPRVVANASERTSVFPTDGMAVLAWGGPLGRNAPRVDTPDTSVRLNSTTPARAWPPRGRSSLPVPWPQPDIVVVPIAVRSHRVSWNPLYHKSRHVSIAF